MLFLDKGNKLATTLLQYFNFLLPVKHEHIWSEKEWKDCRDEKLLKFVAFASRAFYGLQGKVYYIIPNVTQFFIRTHVYRETMKHKNVFIERGKIITFKALFAIMTYNFSIYPPPPSKGFPIFHCIMNGILLTKLKLNKCFCTLSMLCVFSVGKINWFPVNVKSEWKASGRPSFSRSKKFYWQKNITAKLKKKKVAECRFCVFFKRTGI